MCVFCVCARGHSEPHTPLSTPRAPARGTAARAHRAHTAHTQCGIFPGIGPAAESNRVTLRIKYGKIPKKTGISPDPAAESKVGYIPPFWHATVASSPGALALWPSTGAGRGQYAGSALLRNDAVHTVLTVPCAVSCLVFSAQSARSCRFTLAGVGGRRSQRINLTQAVLR